MHTGAEAAAMEVFVYGTLTNRQQAAAALSTFEFDGPATLEGLHRVEGAYPTLAPGGSVAGRLLHTPAVERLDRYEESSANSTFARRYR